MPAITLTGGESTVDIGSGTTAFVLTLPSPADGVGVIEIVVSDFATVFLSQFSGSAIGDGSGGKHCLLTAGQTGLEFVLNGVSAGVAKISIRNTFGYTNPANTEITVIDPTALAATPIVERIEQSLITTLGDVTTGNGYEVTLSVERAAQATNVPADLKAIVSRGRLRQVTAEIDEDVPYNHDGYYQTFEVTVYRAQNATDVDNALALADSDVRKAINANFETDWINNETGDGLVQNIFWNDDTKPVYVNQLPGVLIQFDAFFYTLLNNPYQQ